MLFGVSFQFQPIDKLGMQYVVFFKVVAVLVLDHFVFRGVFIVGVDFLAAFIAHQKHRFDARGGLGADTHGAGGGNGEQSDVAAAVLHHLGVEFRVGLGQTLDEGIQLLAVGVVEGETAALFGHVDRGAVGGAGEGALHLDGELGGFVGAVTQTHAGQHVALGGDAQAGAAAFEAFHLDVEPEVALHALDVVAFGVAVDFGEDFVDLFKFEVDEVVHEALCLGDVVAEFIEIERGFGSEGVVDIAVEVDGDETAAVVGAEGDFAAGVGGDGAVAEVGIAVGDAFAEDGVPEEYTGFGGGPGVVDDFLPEGAGVDFLAHQRVGGVDGVLLHEGFAVAHTLHEFVGYFDADVGTGYFALLQFGVDELFGVGVFDADA